MITYFKNKNIYLLFFLFLTHLFFILYLPAKSMDLTENGIRSVIDTTLQKSEKLGFPKEIRLDRLTFGDNTVNLYIHLPDEFIKRGLTQLHHQELSHELGISLYEKYGMMTLVVYLNDSEKSGQYKLMTDFLKPIQPIINKKGELTTTPTITPISRNSGSSKIQKSSTQPVGGLTGKTIYISPGHGWVRSSTNNRWETQRPAINGIIEDFSNNEAVAEYLLPYLWNAGANVFLMRALNRDYEMQILDNDSSGSHYFQSGSWTTNTSGGYQDGSYIEITSNTLENATVAWSFTVLTSGYYPIYVWYPSGPGQILDAQYYIGYSGGTAIAAINQELHGDTWRYLGKYYFSSTDTGFILLTNQSSVNGDLVKADSVLVGNGWGHVTRHGTVSGKLKIDEGSVYWAEFAGAPYSVTHYYDWYSSDDYWNDAACHQLYAEWEKELSDDAIYLLWHTNASGSHNSSGTWGFAQSNSGWGGTFTGVTGGLEIRNILVDEITNDVRQGYDGSWNGYKQTGNYLWAINSLPGALLEMAFHDNVNRDIPYIRDPKFRQIIARAVYQGVVKYFASRDSTTYTLLPDTPTHLLAENLSNGDIRLSWQSPIKDLVNLGGDTATGFKIYFSTNGYGFDTGTYTTSTEFIYSNLSSGQIYYFRLSALNDGGESLPSETISVRKSNSLPFTKENRILAISGFDRLDGDLLIKTKEYAVYNGSDGYYYPHTSTTGTLVPADRMILPKMNPFNTVIHHSQSVNSISDYYLDNALNETVRDGLVNLEDYRIIDWILGKEGKSSQTMDSTEQARLATFLDNGGTLFISGSDFVHAMDSIGSSNDKLFFNTYFQSSYAGKNGGTKTIQPAPSGKFTDMNSFTFDTGDGLYYGVESTNYINPSGFSQGNLLYGNNPNRIAGIQYAGNHKLVLFTLPFEIIEPESARSDIMYRILNYLSNPATTSVPKELFDIYP